MLFRHEERNNLYAYVGQGKAFFPTVSDKIKLENGDILTLYTRGIWENLDSGELDDVFSEAEEALDVAEKLRDKKYIQEISVYLKLIEALNSADSDYADGKYGDVWAEISRADTYFVENNVHRRSG